MPSTGDSCATCFFAVTPPSDASAPVLSCNKFAPDPGPAVGYPWRAVRSDFWCGEGVSSVNGSRFNAAAVPPSVSAESSGTFALAAVATQNVVDAACKVTSRVEVYLISGHSTTTYTVTRNAGSFDVATNSGVQTGTYGYTIYN